MAGKAGVGLATRNFRAPSPQLPEGRVSKLKMAPTTSQCPE